MWERILVIVRKEFRQALREPRMRGVLIVPPILQLVIFGYAVSLDVERAPIAWMDMDRTPASRELLSLFEGSHHFRVRAALVSEAELRDVLDRGEVLAAVRILPGFGRDVARGRTTAVQVLVDGANSNDAQIVSGYAGRVIGDLARRLAGGAGAPERPVRAETRVWFNPTLESRNYFVPGVIANIVMIMTLMLTAMAIVREKEIGTMEQLMVTPLRAVELILGKTAPFALVGLFNMSLVTGAALAIFGVPLRGSFWLLFGSTLLFLMTTLGAGLFLSTVSHTQQQAMMGTFFFFMPAMMLSGFAFPVRNMPVAVEWLSRLNPLRHFLEIIRGVFLKGVGAEVLWPQMAALAVIGLVVLSASVMRFHKRLD